MITLLLLVRATYIWVLFFAHIPFVVNHTFNATPTERLQHPYRHGCVHMSNSYRLRSGVVTAHTLVESSTHCERL